MCALQHEHTRMRIRQREEACRQVARSSCIRKKAKHSDNECLSSNHHANQNSSMLNFSPFAPMVTTEDNAFRTNGWSSSFPSLNAALTA